MIIKKLSAGDIIEARCTRCRDILNHRIVAMVEEKIVRVECNTCGGVHNYYPPPEQKTAKTLGSGSTSARKTATTAPRATKKDPAQAERDEWASVRQNFRLDRAITYNMTAKFKVNDVVDHSAFGLGVVKLVIAPNKMQVLFEDGIKLLRCK